jgi:hypothetical protein
MDSAPVVQTARLQLMEIAANQTILTKMGNVPKRVAIVEAPAAALVVLVAVQSMVLTVKLSIQHSIFA